MNTTMDSFQRQAILNRDLEGLNPVEVFKKKIDDDISLIVEQSNMYLTQNNDDSFLFLRLIRVFLGIRLLP